LLVHSANFTSATSEGLIHVVTPARQNRLQPLLALEERLFA
jgi:hypothetical protein